MTKKIIKKGLLTFNKTITASYTALFPLCRGIYAHVNLFRNKIQAGFVDQAKIQTGSIFCQIYFKAAHKIWFKLTYTNVVYVGADVCHIDACIRELASACTAPFLVDEL